MLRLENRIALISGAASGIGMAISRKFSAEGAYVALVDIDHPALMKLAGELEKSGKQPFPIVCDVTDELQVAEAVENTVRRFGGLQILVNNAGVSPISPLDEISLSEWEKVMSVNLTGPFLFSKAAFPYLKEAGRKGRLINIGSLSGQIGGIAVGLHYTASKGGSMAMTKQLAKLLAPYQATANSISPGTTDTPLVQNWPEEIRQSLIKQIPLGRLGEAEDVANAALFIASDEAQFITGATINVNGGMFTG